MKIIATHWFTEMGGCLGIVVGEDEITGERKAYIGSGDGFSENADAQKILQRGGKFYPAVAARIIAELEPADADTSKLAHS
jgi:hypothetical protein